MFEEKAEKTPFVSLFEDKKILHEIVTTPHIKTMNKSV